jgi:hypothetical protein
MDARTPAISLTSRQPDRLMTGPARALKLCREGVLVANVGAPTYAVRALVIVDECCSALDPIEWADIFKKPPCVPDLKPRGRDVAKDILEIGNIRHADDGMANENLTDQKLAAHKTKHQLCATNHLAGVLWNVAHQVGAALDGAVIHSGRAHEKQCYANI